MTVLHDPQRLRDMAATMNYSLGRPQRLTPTPDGTAVLFLRSGPRDRVLRLYAMNVATQEVTELLTPDDVLHGAAETLSVEERARRERQRQVLSGFTSFQLSGDGAHILLPLSGRLYVTRRADKRVTALPGEGWIDAKFSPDGRFVAGVQGGELCVVDIAGNDLRPLTSGASETLTHGVAEFAAQEELGRQEGFWWSPDSQTLLYQETDLSPVESLYIADPLHPEQPPASFRYPRAGTPNANVRLGLIPRTGGATTWVTWDHETYPYLARVAWEEPAAPLTLLVLTRRQREAKLLTVDPGTGTVTDLWTETDAAWVNLPPAGLPRWLPDGQEFLWATERGGDWQLELHDRTGRPARALTPTGFHFAGLSDMDAAARVAVVTGGPDPREQHLYRLRLEEGTLEPMSQGSGIFSVVFAKDRRFSIRSHSLMDGATASVLHDSRGRALGEIPSVAETPPSVPTVEITRVGEDRLFDAALVRPRDFQPGRRYPVLLSVYAGPTVKVVRAAANGYRQSQWIADQGYIVVSLDGRGTPGHGRDWERAVQGNLSDIALEDQVAGLHALGAKYPELDLSRVGVNGWSFGGYFAAMATIRRPDVFRCGVSGAPVTDWHDYDTCYTERYMGLPVENPAGYKKASVLPYAPQLERPLLLIHGLTDDNVYFLHTLKLTQALFAAGRPFELLPMTGTHMAGAADPAQSVALWTRILGFLNQNLQTENDAQSSPK